MIISPKTFLCTTASIAKSISDAQAADRTKSNHEPNEREEKKPKITLKKRRKTNIEKFLEVVL